MFVIPEGLRVTGKVRVWRLYILRFGGSRFRHYLLNVEPDGCGYPGQLSWDHTAWCKSVQFEPREVDVRSYYLVWCNLRVPVVRITQGTKTTVECLYTGNIPADYSQLIPRKVTHVHNPEGASLRDLEV